MKLYRAYKWYDYRRYPLLFHAFHNPYHFGIVNFIRWRIFKSKIYIFYMTRYYDQKYSNLPDYKKSTLNFLNLD